MKQKNFLFGIFIMLLLSVGSTWAQRGGNSKMTMWLRMAAQKEQRASQTAQARGMKKPMPRLVTAFVQTREGRASEVLPDYGCQTYAQLGDIAIATIPMNRLGELASHPDVKRIEANPSAQALMDTVPIITNSLPIYQSAPQHPAFTGEGVVMGVMDIGFDLTHPNFYNDATLSRYRIGAFWDQLSKDTIGSEFPVGRDFKGYDEVLAHQHSIDGLTQTHGTHTLGIAAGSGYDTNYRGMAFASDIGLVSNAVGSDIEYIDSADYYKFTTATDALGFKYIFDYADQQGKPCVASFSEGYWPYLDSEDSLYSAFLEKLNGPGHIIVSSAGNEGTRRTYIDKPVGVKAAGSFIQSSETAAFYRIKSDGPMRLRLLGYRSDGGLQDSLVLASSQLIQDSVYNDTILLAGDTCMIAAERIASSFDADTLCYILIESEKNLSQLLPIALVVEGIESHVEVFGSSSNSFSNRSTNLQWNAAEYGHNILAPSCFPSVISVGSIAHRLGFTNYLGEYRDYSNGRVIGKRATSSSTGPTMTGLTKPDVMAPGENIISSYSSFYLEANPEANDIKSDVAHFEHNGRTYAWNSNTGTSMAGPAAAGIIALWLEACPTLTIDDVLSVLSRTCRKPDEAMTYPNNEYGYGEIDGYRGLLDVLGMSKVEDISQHQPQGVSIVNEGNLLKLSFIQPATMPVTVGIYSLAGQRLQQAQVQKGSQNATLSLPKLRAGIYVVQLTSHDNALTGSQIIRL